MNVRSLFPAFGVCLVSLGPSLPAAAEFETPVAITPVTVVTEPGTKIENATILLFKGRITAVGTDIEVPSHAERIDGSGLIAYPGFIDAQTHLGIPETTRTIDERRRMEDDNPDPRESAMPATQAAARRGIRSHFRAAELFVPDETKLTPHRNAGFTAALVAPRDGLLGGTGDLVSLGHAPLRRSILAEDFAMHASYECGEEGEYPRTLLGVFAQFRQVMLDARRHAKLQKYALRHPDTAERVPADAALEALQPVLARSKPIVFEANSEREIHRALDLCAEFNLNVIISGGKEAYKLIDRLKAQRIPLILSLKFDEEPEYGKKEKPERGPRRGRGPRQRDRAEEGQEPEKEKATEKGKEEKKIYEPLKVRQEKRRLWEEQVTNAVRLHEAGIRFAFRTRDFKSNEDFFKNFRMVIERGLSEDAALAAVTRDAAEILGIANQLGRIAPGNLAHLTIMTKPLAEEEAQTKFVFIDGKKFEIDREETDEEKKSEGREEDASAATEKGKDAAPAEETTKPEPKPDESPVFAAEIEQERIPKTKTGGNVLIRNATLIPVSSPAVTDASLLIRNGRIAQMGPAIEAPEGVTVIDATGRFVIPGFVDCHSHLALDSVNESPLAISAEVRIADMIVPDHVGLFRALAGGTTTHHVMHGSANPIGGQNATLKLKYRRPVREMVIEGAPRTIKFALGENVTQANFPENWGKRYPNTRMGVETTMRLAFDEARQYQQEWDEYARRSKAGEDVPPPRQDLRLEALADVLGGRMTVHCHCYRSEEILRLFDVAETYGIRIGTLHHVLEGYRIAPEIARHGAGASTFSNFWAYKVEAFGAIPHNAAMMTRFGVNSSLNSDSADTIRYFGLEAAKTVRWGDLDETEALKLVTLNPAMQLGIEDRVGSLEVGKDGDVAIFNGHPLNSFSKCVMTLIEGEVYFEDARPEPIEEVDAGTGWPKAFPPFRGVLDRTIPETPHRAYAIIHATIHPMADPNDPALTIDDGTVVVIEDRIHAVGKDVDIPPGAGVINAAGLHVYPGLVDAGSTLGLDEIGSLRATRDHGEIATFNPQVVAGSAVHPHSEHLRITRAVGVTTTLARPTGARIAGQSSLVHLDGWTAPEMVIAGRFGLHVTVPSLPVDLAGTDEFVPLELAACPRSDCMIIDELGEPPFFRRRRGAALDDEAKKKQRDEHKKAVRELEDFLAKAKHYAKVQALAESDAQIPFERDLALEAMMPYVKGEKPVVLSANQFKEILDAMEFAEKHQLRWILAGGSESWKLAAALAEKNIPVILGPPTMQPRGDFEPWDSVYRCAGELDRAGVRFCFASGSAADAYNLPIEMGLAVAHGLPRVKAEYALTRGAAEILGVAGERGSIEVGKMADLIVTTSSPVQAVNQVTHMFIDGRPIDLSNMHEENYEKFMSRPNPHLPPPKDLRGPKNLTNAARWRDAVGWRGRKEGVDDNSWHPSPTKSAERAAAEDDRPAEGRQAPGP